MTTVTKLVFNYAKMLYVFRLSSFSLVILLINLFTKKKI